MATIKAMMMVENGQILPNAGFNEFNPAIEEKDKLCVCFVVLNPLVTKSNQLC